MHECDENLEFRPQGVTCIQEAETRHTLGYRCSATAENSNGICAFEVAIARGWRMIPSVDVVSTFWMHVTPWSPGTLSLGYRGTLREPTLSDLVRFWFCEQVHEYHAAMLNPIPTSLAALES